MKSVLFVILALVLVVGNVSAQEMTAEEWQAEMDRYTQLRDEMSATVNSTKEQIATMKAQSAKSDADLKKCLDELYALVGSNATEAAAYRAQIAAAEARANNLMRLSDADLLARSAEVDGLETEVKGLWGNKLSVIPEFYDKLKELDGKVASLKKTLAGAAKVYTVGTWSRDRDCLWNISKKKDIYNNAWMWPKIWQGNRDQIKDPDIIHPGQKLKIPAAGPMTADEKAAAQRYYSTKVTGE
ncbi:MAG: LysM peptidoglycan-binding domain-containing protein [Ignavibacteria bacterium]|nr:LysM peptidoglycan-binding domain-containing protein [Ignavibacteria bacterium]